MQKKSDQLPLICLVGPTAVGKSAVAMRLAELFNAEIINADSRQFYRELQIGTAKPSLQEREQIVHHLIDCTSITNLWSVAQFVEAANEAITLVRSKNKLPLLVGGTGLYFRSLVYGLSAVPEIDEAIRANFQERLKTDGLDPLYDELKRIDPDMAAELSPNDTQRILRALEVFRQTGKSLRTFWSQDPRAKRFSHMSFCLNLPREELYQKIDQRVLEMFQKGLREETLDLWTRYRDNELLTKTIGYAEWIKYGFKNIKTALSKIQQHTRNFAKRQLTWFKKEPALEWIEVFDFERTTQKINTRIKGLHKTH